jgi:hypothetical protein
MHLVSYVSGVSGVSMYQGIRVSRYRERRGGGEGSLNNKNPDSNRATDGTMRIRTISMRLPRSREFS